MKLPFTKMHGAGNHFVMLNGITHDLPSDLESLSKAMAHPQFGIGHDQVLIAYKSDSADFRMDIYNADGGRVEMCGNGIRAFAKFLLDQKLTDKTELTIETLAGPIKPYVITDHPKTSEHTAWVNVDMGAPILEGRQIPVDQDGRVLQKELDLSAFKGVNWSGIKEHPFKISCVSMGNPHCVIFVNDVKNFPVTQVGPIIETHPFFPKRVNVEFVERVNDSHLIQRTWERGAGETYACGTGASAVAVAAHLAGLTGRKVTISLLGGDLDLNWCEKTGHVFKTGPATTVFEGALDTEALVY